METGWIKQGWIISFPGHNAAMHSSFISSSAPQQEIVVDAFFVKHARQSFYILFKRLAFLENLHKASLQPIFENKESMNSKLYFYEETGPQRSQKEPKRSQMMKKELKWNIYSNTMFENLPKCLIWIFQLAFSTNFLSIKKWPVW